VDPLQCHGGTIINAKFIHIGILLTILYIPVMGQTTGTTCWQCPVCGTIIQLTSSEVAKVIAYPYNYICPVCGKAYEVNFMQVSCATVNGLSQPELRNEKVEQTEINGSYQQNDEILGQKLANDLDSRIKYR
jgi:hypothetical protein